MKIDFSKKIALVTGGTSGIGRAVSMVLAKAGANVAASSVDIIGENGEGLVEAIQQEGHKCKTYEIDVTKEEEIKELVDRVTNDFGGIDILVNSAGWRIRNPALNITKEDWNRTLDTCLGGSFFCAQAVAPIMINRGGGSIVNISSLSGVNGRVNGAHYGAAKSAIINITKTLAMEWAKYNIRVNSVVPGPIFTEGFRKLRKLERCEDFEAHNALKRAGTPEEVAYTIAFLASDFSSYITGENLEICGGPQDLG